MARLKVTVYMDIDDMEDGHFDPNHPSGLTEEGFLHFSGADGTSGPPLGHFEDLETEVVD